MGFYRATQPASPGRAPAPAVVTLFLRDDIAFETRSADPFMVAHDCLNPAGHEPIASCGEVVCCHCAKVFWR